jgi:hypothetical protein
VDESQTAVWKDGQGRAWSLAITVNTIKRVRELADVNLLDAFDGRLFIRLGQDFELLVNVIYAVCQPRAVELGVSEEDFAELLCGDALEAAGLALVQGVLDFFPKDRRAALEKLWAATTKSRAAGMTLLATKLEADQVGRAIGALMDRTSRQVDRELQTLIEGSGSSPVSSASTRAP